MEFSQKVTELFKYAAPAMKRLVASNSSLFQSINERDAANAVVAQLRLNAENIPSPQNEQEAYELLETILGKVLSENVLAVPSYGLSKQGEIERAQLVSIYTEGRQPPPSPLEEVKALYATNKTAFMQRRAQDESFRVLSDQCLAEGGLK